MNILHIIHCLDMRSGGPPTALRDLAMAQRIAGNHISIIATNVQAMDPWLSDKEFRQSIEDAFSDSADWLRMLGGFGRRGLMRRFRYSPLCKSAIASRIKEAAIEVIHIHGLFSHLVMSACDTAREMDIPYILRPAGGLDEFCFSQGASMIKRLAMKYRVRRQLENASALHATSEREAEALSRLFPKTHVVSVPHGVTLPTDESLRESYEAILSIHPELDGSKILLYMGRFTPKKRPDLLLKLFRQSTLPSNGWKLVMAGDGPMNERLRELGGESVYFTGFLQGVEKLGMMGAANCFCLPSLSENFGVAVAEAMASGVPVLTTQGVDLSEALMGANAGLVIDMTEEALLAGLNRLESLDLKQMGTNGRQFAMQHMSWGLREREIDRMYREALSRGL